MNNRTLIPLAVAVLVLLISIGLYAGGYYLLSSATQKSEDLQKQIAAKSLDIEKATRARAELATLSADEATLDQYSIGKADVVPFLETLQASGKPLGATVKVLSVGDETVGANQRVALSLAISGTFDAVMRTLGAIEYGPYDGVVSSLTLDTSSDGKGTVWTAATLYSVGLRAASTTKP